MVSSMQRLTIEVEDCVSGRIERSRGSMSPGEFAARAVAGHMTIDGNGTTAMNAHMHDEMAARLYLLQQPVERLNDGLKSRGAPGARAR